ncbi:aldehyde dehydrogenase [Acrocarpospora catenulata]|uniref:aldehyde dehydrogenase n=1 Tax=Acrocarpospora catenulata TaxID=2836182 RepID=UPI001BDAFBD8|nr:aldehyde dehydrogenase [Acrocarpospora catenulata]
MEHDIKHLYIGGEYVAPHSASRIEVVNPANGQRIGSIVDGDATDVARAAEAADRAFRTSGWAELTPKDRAAYIRRLADAYVERGAEMARLVSSENGMPISFSRLVHEERPARYYRYFAGVADTLELEHTRPTSTGYAIVRREPIGVAGLIIPWNGPQGLIAWKLGPALAAGCAVVIKPSPETTLDAFLLSEAIEQAGFPPGLINIVSGGPETGQALVDHPLITKIAFTGSSATGKIIAARAGAQLKPVTLELGGKSAAILLDDADLEEFGARILEVCLPNTGQQCTACTRVLAPRDKYDQVVELATEVLARVPVGDPADPKSVFGPLVSARQRARVESYIAAGLREGARLTTGGGRPAGLEDGCYVEPTVFRDVSNDMRIAREEIFGPVLSIIPYDGEEEAIAIANDSTYGLSGAVFSRDVDHATDVARRLQTGTVGVDQFSIALEAPFGGYKESGLGRELGPESVDAYLRTKTIYRAGSAPSA